MQRRVDPSRLSWRHAQGLMNPAEVVVQEIQRYGPTKKIDLIHPSSIWNEPQYWTMGLRREDRVYSYLWPSEGGRCTGWSGEQY